MPARTIHRIAASLTLALLAPLAAPGCGGRDGRAYGEPVVEAEALTLGALMAGDVAERTGTLVTVSGRVGTVCRSAGCWLTLQDRSGDEPVEIFVDLKRAATFTVPASLEGRDVVVLGRLDGRPPDLWINAVGLVVK